MAAEQPWVRENDDDRQDHSDPNRHPWYVARLPLLPAAEQREAREK